MTLDSLNNLKVVPRSLILVATQLLLNHFQMKWVIDTVAKGTNVSEIYNVVGQRGAKKSLIIPFISREHWVSLLSILEWINPPVPAHWMINGQAARGARQHHLFGDAGNCGIVWSKDILKTYYAINPTVNLSDEAKAKRLTALPDCPVLRINTQSIIMPAPSVCDRIMSALQGKPVLISASEYLEATPVITGGLRLTAVEQDDKTMLLCRTDAVDALATSKEVAIP